MDTYIPERIKPALEYLEGLRNEIVALEKDRSFESMRRYDAEHNINYYREVARDLLTSANNEAAPAVVAAKNQISILRRQLRITQEELAIEKSRNALQILMRDEEIAVLKESAKVIA